MTTPRRWKLAASLLLFAAFVPLGCGSHAAWVTVKSATGRFSATFPVNPIETSKTITAAGRPIKLNALDIARKDRREYAVLWCDYPQDIMALTHPARVLDNVRKGYEADGHKILTDTLITVCGKPARELEVDVGGGMISRVRLLMVDNRLYQIMTYTPAASHTDPDLAKFLDSFSLTES